MQSQTLEESRDTIPTVEDGDRSVSGAAWDCILQSQTVEAAEGSISIAISDYR